MIITNKTFKDLLLKVAIIIPPFIFFWMFFKYTVDIPVNDDYNAILDFINKYIESDSLSEKIQLIFSQHNEHRIVYDRIWTIVCYEIFGQVNFNYLALVGNLSLFGFFWIFYNKIKEVTPSLFFLIPISVLIFNLTFHENITFAMATMSNLTGLLFSLLSLFFITKQNLSLKDFIFSILFFLLSIFTQGAGLFLVPILLLTLMFKKKWSYLTYLFIFVGIVLLVYFYQYQKPIQSPDLIDTIKYFKVRSILFSLAFLGSAFNYNLIFTNDLNESIGLTTVIGFFLFALYLYIFKSNYYRKNLFIFSVMTLVIITSFVTALTRSQLGIETAGSSRYRINGVVFLISIYIWLIETYKLDTTFKKTLLIIISLAYLYFFNIKHYEYLYYREKGLYYGIINFHSGDYSKLYGFEQELYNKKLIESYHKKTYFLPSYKSLKEFYPVSKEIIKTLKYQQKNEINYNIDDIAKIKDGYLIEGWTFLDGVNTKNQIVFLAVKSNKSNKLKFFSTKQVSRFDLNPYFKRNDLKQAGFIARINDIEFEQGENEIYLLLNIENQYLLKQINKKIVK